jgi:hypothetical protein
MRWLIGTQPLPEIHAAQYESALKCQWGLDVAPFERKQEGGKR